MLGRGDEGVYWLLYKWLCQGLPSPCSSFAPVTCSVLPGLTREQNVKDEKEESGRQQNGTKKSETRHKEKARDSLGYELIRSHLRGISFA